MSPLSALPKEGRIRLAAMLPFVSISKGTVHRLVAAGKFPAPIQLSERCSLYDCAEVHRWIENPNAYRIANDKAVA